MSNERGYTLAEMLVVCAIVGLVMASLLGLVVSGQKAFWYGTTQVDAQQTARVALERMVKEIREAGYYPQNPDTAPTTCSAPPCYAYLPTRSRAGRRPARSPCSTTGTVTRPAPGPARSTIRSCARPGRPVGASG